MTIEEKNSMLGEEPEEEVEEEEEEEEEEIEDPQDKLREVCNNKPSCQSYRQEFQACEERVNSRSQTEEHCTQELFDFLHCTDKCVSDSLFKYLK